MNLYELNSQYKSLMDAALEHAEEFDGEVPAYLSDQIDALDMERTDEVANTARYIKNLRAEAAAVKIEEQKLYQRRKSAERHADWAENYLSGILQGERFSDATAAVSWRKSEVVVTTRSPEQTDEFARVKIETSWDKTAIKDAIKAGRELDFAKIEIRNNIQIK